MLLTRSDSAKDTTLETMTYDLHDDLSLQGHAVLFFSVHPNLIIFFHKV